MNALYFISQTALSEVGSVPNRSDGPPIEWLQHVADKVTPECKHPDCKKRLCNELRLLTSCYLDLPPIDLSLRVQEQKFYAQKDTYAILDCCKLDKFGVIKGDMLFYGTLLSHQLLQKEV